MMELWGADSCVSCVQAKMLMGKTPLEWKYVDVATTGFEGRIPRLVLDDGRVIVDLGPINNFIKQEIIKQGLDYRPIFRDVLNE